MNECIRFLLYKGDANTVETFFEKKSIRNW